MIVTLTVNNEQVDAAEALLDFIFFLHGKKPAEAIVIAASNEIHEEFRTKIRLAAEVAFADVDMIYPDAANLFGAAVERMIAYKQPWLYIDPYCVPLVPRWLDAIEDSYSDQPKVILGPHQKDGEKIWLNRFSVYPPDLCKLPTGNYTSLSTKTRVIQIGKYEKREDVRDKSQDDPAYLFCGDKTGELIKAIRAERKK